MRVALLGLGLIGGSIARALSAETNREEPLGEAGVWDIAAWTPDGRGPRAAVAAGVIGHAAGSIAEAVAGAELVILAAPPVACLALLDGLAAPGVLGARALVTDVASTKTAIVERAASRGLPFVGGHPMAGRETSGFGASDAGFFLGRPWVVVAPENAEPGQLATVIRLVRACGANPIQMTPTEHDAAVAAISHLPLVVAAALVEAVVGSAGGPERDDWPAARALAATGWASATRLARGEVAMAKGIAATNGPAIADRLRDLERVIAAWRTELEAGDATAMEARFASARARLEASNAEPDTNRR